MRVITTTGERSVNLVLRHLGQSTDYDVILQNESTKVISTIQVTSTVVEINSNLRQLNIPFTETYNEGDEFSLKVIETGQMEVLHRNKIFVTDKDPQNYSNE